MSALSGLAKLRAALWQMERDLGLEDLSRNERDVLYAFHAAAAQASEADIIASETVRNDRSISEMKHATFHRSLKRLLELGYIELAPDRKTKLYRLGKAVN
jgi:DNA-binding transcriptional ArsR family regulator